MMATATASASGITRYTGGVKCPVCGGSEGDKRHQGSRCAGYLPSGGTVAFCTRDEFAGGLPLDGSQTPAAYKHKLAGQCDCGKIHGFAPSKSSSKPSTKSQWAPPGKLVRSDIYEDVIGGKVVRNRKVDRYLLADGDKTIRQSYPSFGPNGDFSRWIGKNLKDLPPILFRRPKLLTLPKGSTVYVVEGEPKVEAIETTGLHATCNPGGTGMGWRDHYSPDLAGQHVVILPDNDDKGRAHAEKVARSVAPIAASVKVLDLPGLPEKGDIVDWLKSGHSIQDMAILAVGAEAWSPRPTPEEGGVAPTLKIVHSDEPPPEGSVAAYPDQGRRFFRRTDIGNAERMRKLFGHKIRFCHPWKKWLIWDGRRWKVDKSGLIYRIAIATARSIYNEAARAKSADERAAIVQFAKATEKKQRLDAMVSLCASLEGVPVLPDQLDRNPWLLNTRNCTVDLLTGQGRPHDKADLLTKMVPADFDPDAECPLFHRTLRTFLVTDEVIGYWQRLCGMAITGVIEDHILPICYGTGSNGKSTLLNVLLETLGKDYAMKAMPDLLIAKKADSHPTDKADLFGMRIVVAIETEEGARLNESFIKELTGGDRVRARRMREDPWEFEPTHTVFLATNHKPQVRGTDHGIWRRLKLVPFGVKMPDDEADLSMPSKLKAELPGILAWMVRGCVAWKTEGLQTPGCVTEATSRYRQDEDILGGFILERCVVLSGVAQQAKPLYDEYRKWAVECGLEPSSLVKFGKAIAEKGFEKDQSGKSNVVRYLGIALRAHVDDPGPGRRTVAEGCGQNSGIHSSELPFEEGNRENPPQLSATVRRPEEDWTLNP